ncbi:MAG: DUF3347 domain-containing protein [Chitinophagaceae bacterium]|nr:DUF3347 domain-containing protein [Chitinophagaceae bacterium]
MKKFFAIFFAILILATGYIYFTYFKGGKKAPKGPKPVPMAVSTHSAEFNQSVKNTIATYYDLSEALVNWNEEATNQQALALTKSLDSLRVDELKNDTTGIYETALDPLSSAKAEASTILVAGDWEARRRAFQNLSENLRLLMIVVKYDQEKLYWQECPMAFNGNEAAHWLSPTEAVRNPYLGTSHPEYKGTMLTCGAPKDTINFMKK